jgi:hypothetical protein
LRRKPSQDRVPAVPAVPGFAARALIVDAPGKSK